MAGQVSFSCLNSAILVIHDQALRCTAYLNHDRGKILLDSVLS